MKKAIIILLSSVIVSASGCSAGAPKQVENRSMQADQTVIFKDQALDTIIREELKRPTGEVRKKDVETLTELRASQKNIVELTGLENLTNLKKIVLNDNPLKDINPLRELTNLEELYLTRFALMDAKNRNEFSDLTPLAKLSRLSVLEINSSIKDLTPLKELINLKKLSLFWNEISNISALQGLTQLTELNLSGNKINDINALRGLTNLTSLDLYNNEISDISTLKGLTQLKILRLSSNKINDVSALQSLTNLTKLELTDNKIRSSDLEALKKALPNCTIVSSSQNPAPAPASPAAPPLSDKKETSSKTTPNKWESVFNPVMVSLDAKYFNNYVDEIYGEIKNYTKKDWNYVEITLNLYDENNKQVGKAYSKVAGKISPNQVIKFKSEGGGLSYLKAKKYELASVSPM
ncbi:leucine-rich repeat domain-containing protein [Paenibacillus radicis (ex Xue et al. 2023)]|uniref:Leucine-rich repeat domain-containing protein n=1 Tax=Paenibacillus radicis (ex Xue et al. 2023) TaxID=2972489 RepID=A0ABT1Y9T1_9BACL|nr:leucine-rich repeat domain-containing protein [Paenibacillus radicis (ex Xue et al. 2023)]MCR8629948.1 leucine-rich repeat domain-containing protein [Paenibacillus radicis (ex Xue et al. 2023)]